MLLYQRSSLDSRYIKRIADHYDCDDLVTLLTDYSPMRPQTRKWGGLFQHNSPLVFQGEKYDSPLVLVYVSPKMQYPFTGVLETIGVDVTFNTPAELSAYIFSHELAHYLGEYDAEEFKAEQAGCDAFALRVIQDILRWNLQVRSNSKPSLAF